jgi:hypothetical protein
VSAVSMTACAARLSGSRRPGAPPGG